LGTEGAKPTDDLLDGWKAIAEHLGKTERTVQRWEKSKGLPVRRLQAESPEEQPRVFAYKSEVDFWWKNHQTKLKQTVEKEDVEEETAVATTPPRSRIPQRAVYALLTVILMVAVVALAWPAIRSRLRPREKVLGVMPVKNLGGAGEPQQLAEALTEEMVTGLGRLQPKSFRVIQLAPDQSKTAGLDYLLTGSVQRAGNRVAITAQLILAKDRSRIWGKSYERNLKDPEDIIPIEIEITDATIKELLPLLPRDNHPPKQVTPDAYEAYLWGRLLWNKRTTESLFQAIKYFQRAIDTEPTYAPAYAGLADCYFLLGSVPYTALPPDEAFPKAEANARKALELDPSLAEAHISLGYSALVYRRDSAESEKQFQAALWLRPEYAPAHAFYAYHLTAVGRMDAAIAERQKARSLEPLSPIFNTSLGEAYYQARQFDLAIQESQKSLVADPDYPDALMNIARDYEQQGSYSKADAVLQRILAARSGEPAVIAMAGHEYAVAGRSAQARAMLSKLREASKQRYVSPLYFALIYIGLGDKNEAFRWLNQAYDERSDYLVFLRSEPWADPLRKDPRFAAFLAKLGLPAYQNSSPATH
jgi:tetratricopeptide (TPR) repeat protein